MRAARWPRRAAMVCGPGRWVRRPRGPGAALHALLPLLLVLVLAAAVPRVRDFMTTLRTTKRAPRPRNSSDGTTQIVRRHEPSPPQGANTAARGCGPRPKGAAGALPGRLYPAFDTCRGMPSSLTSLLTSGTLRVAHQLTSESGRPRRAAWPRYAPRAAFFASGGPSAYAIARYTLLHRGSVRPGARFLRGASQVECGGCPPHEPSEHACLDAAFPPN
jgi:hypothetical protein